MASLLISAAEARAEYQVNIGDTLEIAVAGVPDLRHRAPVQIDGNISLPLVGTVPVVGLTVPQIRSKLGSAFARKVFRQRVSDGSEIAVVIDASEVTATLAEYRPIYVNGDVSKPGEYPYRPSSTVRQVIAVAGGYDVMHMRMGNPYLESADLRSQYAALWTEFAKAQVRISRIKVELGAGSQIDSAVVKDVPLPVSTISDILRTETEYLTVRQADYRREMTFLKRGVQDGEQQIKVLTAQQTTEEEGYQSDLDELRKVLELFGKGALVSPRVTDARRAVLLSSTRKLQTSAQLMEVKRQQDDVARKLERLDDQRKIELLRDLQEANAVLSETRAKLQGVGEKLQYTAMVRSQLVQGTGGDAKIVIVRRAPRGSERIAADEDTELQPGDTIEVALKYQDGPDSSLPKLSSSDIR